MQQDNYEPAKIFIRIQFFFCLSSNVGVFPFRGQSSQNPALKVSPTKIPSELHVDAGTVMDETKCTCTKAFFWLA